MVVSWQEFKNSLAKNTSDDNLCLKIAFVHITLRLNELFCIGISDRPGDFNVDKDLTDAEVACGLPDSVQKRSFVYRDKTNNDKIYVLSVYPEDKGEKLLVILDSPDDMTSTHATLDLGCDGERDKKVDELLKSLREGPPTEPPTPDCLEKLPGAHI